MPEPPRGLARWLARPTHARRQGPLFAVVAGLVLLIGVVDFAMGFETSLLVFYFLPVCLAVALRGRWFGVATAVASVVTWVAGDFAAGAHFSNSLVPWWNALIALGTYLVLIWLVSSLLELQARLEDRVRQRTAALRNEIAERERLEKILLEISERERRSIGHDLHDGLGQHLTATAITGQVLLEKLRERGAVEAAELQKVIALIKSGIEQTRALAKGLLLAEISPDGLPAALEELATITREQFRVECRFEGGAVAPHLAAGAATHFYRIAFEAVRNAVRHGRPRRLDVVLAENAVGDLTLTVRDDGSGLPPPGRRGEGLGLRIMAHRAQIIGASFAIESSEGGGTLMTCRLPAVTPATP